MQPIVLASGSAYRASLLAKLSIPFETSSPDVDESPADNEQAKALALRLSQAKAKALEHLYPDHLIIGSDQVAEVDGVMLGKPGIHDKAIQQLKMCSGKRVVFYTGLCVYHSATGEDVTTVETFEVSFRHLTDEQIDSYLKKETPYDCAGSFKCEGLGISLFEEMHGRDPNALIGLPLIALTDALLHFGVDPLTA